jgi:hypothetical protein
MVESSAVLAIVRLRVITSGHWLLIQHDLGIDTSIVPAYHSQSSRARSRGRAVIGELFILDVGWLIAQFLTLGFSFVNNSAQWVYCAPCFQY